VLSSVESASFDLVRVGRSRVLYCLVRLRHNFSGKKKIGRFIANVIPNTPVTGSMTSLRHDVISVGDVIKKVRRPFRVLLYYYIFTFHQYNKIAQKWIGMRHSVLFINDVIEVGDSLMTRCDVLLVIGLSVVWFRKCGGRNK
jgi:hypothetical protein